MLYKDWWKQDYSAHISPNSHSKNEYPAILKVYELGRADLYRVWTGSLHSVSQPGQSLTTHKNFDSEVRVTFRFILLVMESVYSSPLKYVHLP